MSVPSEIEALIDQLQQLKQQQAELTSLLHCTHVLYQQLLQAITSQHLQVAATRSQRIAVIPPSRQPAERTHVPASASTPEPTPPPEPEVATNSTPLVQEINERMGMKNPSLNDRLKQPATELAEKLSHAPVPDLRKAIGINDRFLFISELFANDYQSYDQAIETLNSCTSWDEARQWIADHLQTRYQWKEKDPTAEAFYAIVKKRFSAR
ncbi:hypothetical protein [Thermoflavifilum thermophilum]|uniref:Uncharacterized protein n=1 Tax=Thermoflavifilum thermophilum TaxID=1393122 RepID=A0A1I7NFT3_9BACT|nr:hypothetical protein [Thermoflavifilum thermophilum]SFV33463.1 hypothetical protein SAMN05660895_1714 [Thermoflavifilum thermophilum]